MNNTNSSKNTSGVHLEKGYASLMTNYYGVDPTTQNPVDRKLNTHGGRLFDRAQTLYETSSRLADGSSMLSEAMTLVSNPKASKTSIKNAIRLVRKSIVPLLDIAVNTTCDAAKEASPIAGGKVAHRMEEVKRVREIAEEQPKKKPKIILLDLFIKSNGSPHAFATQSRRMVIPARKNTPFRSAKKGRALPMNGPQLPVPRNGLTYGVGEFIEIVTQFPKGSSKRGQMIKMMLEKKYVKRTQGTVRAKLHAHEVNGVHFELDEQWNTKGRRPLLNEAELTQCAESCKKYNGTTLCNYLARFAKRDDFTLQLKTNPKTNNRWTAEHSTINAMAFIIIVAMTHFYVVDEEDIEWRACLRQLPAEDKMLYYMVSYFHAGKPVMCRRAEHIVNCDDETSFICFGIQPEKESE